MSGNRCENRYRMVRMLSSGSFGEIRLATDQFLNREVAIKVIHSRFMDNSSVVDRFLQEAETIAILEHPNIIPIYDSGKLDDGRPYFSMRLVEGGTLEQRTNAFHEENRRVPAAQRFRSDAFFRLVSSLRDTGRAVQFTHAKGIVHRDLKPSNVLIGNDGHTYLIDWGTAKGVNQSRDQRAVDLGVTMVAGQDPQPPSEPLNQTVHGMILGTPAFMSPEQAQGRTDLVSPQSDIYGLGAALYFIITGRAPHRGDHIAEVLGKAQKGEITGPKAVVEDVPDILVRICDRALQPNPEDRYQSVEQFLNDLERFLSTESGPPALPASRTTPKVVTRRASVWPLIALSVAVLMFISSSTGFYLQRRENAALKDQSQQALRDLAMANDMLAAKNSDNNNSSVDGKQDERLVASVKRLQGELEAAQSELKNANDSLNVANNTIDELNETIENNDAELESVQSRLASAEADREQVQEQFSEIQTRLAELQDEKKTLEERMARVSESSGENATELAKRERELRDQLQQSQERLAAMQAELEDATTKLDLQTELARSEQQRAEDIAETLDRTNGELGNAMRNIRDLEQQMDELKVSMRSRNDSEMVSSHFDANQLTEMIGQQYETQFVSDDQLQMVMQGVDCRLILSPNGDLMLAAGLPIGDWSIEKVNEWNKQHRWSRAYFSDEVERVFVESDLAVSDGVTETRVKQYIEQFDDTLKLFKAYGGGSPDNPFSDDDAPLNFSTFGR